ncbi:DMT family transporter [Alistipes ihumii]|uniref:DMT family transporter n=2 Tax=Alistipes ihumii TaxID=1470347 RepID=A0ABY5UZ47_9BACT|nr:DMT family transporter [Alistipes ihumii]MBS6703797.1 DMT family transporter [Alistipes indistinctus]UWN57216.1 DMT family transporter [Alistipes ihumii AP11]
MEDRNIRGHAAMLGVGVIFGLLSPVSKALLDSGLISPAGLMMTRTAGAAAAFWTASLFVRREPVALRDRLSLFFAALLGIVLNQGSFILGVSMTSPIDASVVTTTAPIFAMIIAALYLREPITGMKIAGVAIGAVGALMLILSSPAAASSGSGSIGGDLLCMFAQLSYATYFVVFKGLIGRYGPVTLMKWMFLFATLCWLPFGAEDFVSTRWQAFGWRNFAEVGFIVLGATFLTYLLLPVGQKNLRPTVGCMYNYLQPLVASLVAVLAGMDRFTTIKAAAVVLVFAGVYAVTRSKSKAQMDAEASRR